MTEALFQRSDDRAHEPHAAAAALSRAQKAAIILCLLDRDGAGPLFERLDEGSVKSFFSAMARLGRIDGATVRVVVTEFLSDLASREDSVQGGARNALTMIDSHLGQAATAKLADAAELLSETDVWKRMAMVGPKVLAEFLSREHPQSVAMILSKLPAEHAGKVLSELEPEQACQIVAFFRRMKTLSAQSIGTVGESIGQTLFSNRLNTSALTPAARVGLIVNFASSKLRDDVIEHLDKLDSAFAEEVKKNMFTFADIETRVERKDVSAVMRAIDQAVLVKALSGAAKTAPTVKKFLLSNISSRMAEMIEQEIKDAGEVKRNEVDAAQAEVIKTIRALVKSGEIALVGEDEE